jgi:hypothetical protein
MPSHDALQAALLAQLSSAILALLRDAQDDGLDGLSISASADAGHVSIDLAYMAGGVPVSGHSL